MITRKTIIGINGENNHDGGLGFLGGAQLFDDYLDPLHPSNFGDGLQPESFFDPDFQQHMQAGPFVASAHLLDLDSDMKRHVAFESDVDKLLAGLLS